MNGAAQITRERSRQLVEEGFDQRHDVENHERKELASAAKAYLTDYCASSNYHDVPPMSWPWPGTYDPELGQRVGCGWKPTPADPIRQLVKAGALIAAEIDRLIAIQSQEEYLEQMKGQASVGEKEADRVIELHVKIPFYGKESQVKPLVDRTRAILKLQVSDGVRVSVHESSMKIT